MQTTNVRAANARVAQARIARSHLRSHSTGERRLGNIALTQYIGQLTDEIREDLTRVNLEEGLFRGTVELVGNGMPIPAGLQLNQETQSDPVTQSFVIDLQQLATLHLTQPQIAAAIARSAIAGYENQGNGGRDEIPVQLKRLLLAYAIRSSSQLAASLITTGTRLTLRQVMEDRDYLCAIYLVVNGEPLSEQNLEAIGTAIAPWVNAYGMEGFWTNLQTLAMMRRSGQATSATLILRDTLLVVDHLIPGELERQLVRRLGMAQPDSAPPQIEIQVPSSGRSYVMSNS